MLELVVPLGRVRRELLERVGAVAAGASTPMRFSPAGTRPQSSQAPSTIEPPQEAHFKLELMRGFLDRLPSPPLAGRGWGWGSPRCFATFEACGSGTAPPLAPPRENGEG